MATGIFPLAAGLMDTGGEAGGLISMSTVCTQVLGGNTASVDKVEIAELPMENGEPGTGLRVPLLAMLKPITVLECIIVS